MTHKLALFAGSAAAAIFVISQLPMLIKARRTKDLSSYSLANIGLANLGNLLYAAYLAQVPLGPAWAIHGFNLTTGTDARLVPALRLAPSPTRPRCRANTTGCSSSPTPLDRAATTSAEPVHIPQIDQSAVTADACRSTCPE